LKKKMYLVRRAEPKVHYPVTAATMMAEATRLRAIDGKTVDLHVVNDHGESDPEPAQEKTRGRKKSLINPVDAEPRTEPMSGHAESSGGQQPPETDDADPGQPDPAD
jgi:hypothetical protein